MRERWKARGSEAASGSLTLEAESRVMTQGPETPARLRQACGGHLRLTRCAAPSANSC